MLECILASVSCDTYIGKKLKNTKTNIIGSSNKPVNNVEEVKWIVLKAKLDYQMQLAEEEGRQLAKQFLKELKMGLLARVINIIGR